MTRAEADGSIFVFVYYHEPLKSMAIAKEAPFGGGATLVTPMTKEDPFPEENPILKRFYERFCGEISVLTEEKGCGRLYSLPIKASTWQMP